jgi:uncharacterized membrane protein YqgA involved in biofilm formation
MAATMKPAVKRIVIALLAIVAIYFVGRLILTLIWRLFSFTMFLVQVLLPMLVLAALVWFVYRVWGRSHFRARKIDRIRNARYLKEAVDRGKEGN